MSESEDDITTTDAAEQDPAADQETSAIEDSAETVDTAKKDEMAENVPSELIQSIAQPISANSPCGESVKYDDDFEKIKTEFDKLSDLDYEMIQELSSALLQEKTKDILVGAYLAVSLFMSDGLKGLAEGLSVLDVLTSTFWDDLLPPKMTARASAITFFVQKASAQFERYEPTMADGPTLTEVIAQMKSFQTFTMGAMGEHAPVLSGFIKILDGVGRKVPKPKAETRPTATSAASATGGGAPLSIASKSDAEKVIQNACQFLHQNDWKNPAPYRVVRALRWGRISNPPPNTDQKTQLGAPPAARLSALNDMITQSKNQEALEACQSLFVEGASSFYLDIQRITSLALGNLGAPYDAARLAVHEETALFLQRVPDVKDLLYADGTPFVTPLCTAWLEADIDSLLAGSGSGSDTNEGDAEFEESIKEAQKLVQKGKLADAINLINALPDSDKSSKKRFRVQLVQADLCIKGAQPGVARAILEKLRDQIDSHGLAEWDPDSALSALSLLRTCYSTLAAKTPPPQKAELFQKANDVFESICKIDAAYALTVS